MGKTVTPLQAKEEAFTDKIAREREEALELMSTFLEDDLLAARIVSGEYDIAPLLSIMMRRIMLLEGKEPPVYFNGVKIVFNEKDDDFS